MPAVLNSRSSVEPRGDIDALLSEQRGPQMLHVEVVKAA
jgi:hypothetical protein